MPDIAQKLSATSNLKGSIEVVSFIRVLVSDLSADTDYPDLDGGKSGIAISGYGAGGTWLYSNDKSNGISLPISVSDYNAILLDVSAEWYMIDSAEVDIQP
jgi:hypothetical protein